MDTNNPVSQINIFLNDKSVFKLGIPSASYTNFETYVKGNNIEIKEGETDKQLMFTSKNSLNEVLLPYLKLNQDIYSDFIFAVLPQLISKNYEKYLTSVGNFIKTNLSNIADKTLYYGMSSVLGAFLGDAMGSYVEFTMPNDENRKSVWKEQNRIWGTRKGQVTDDSEMAFSMAYGLLESNGLFNPERIAYFYKLWTYSPPFDIGSTTRAALCGNDNVKKCIYFEGLSKRLNENSKQYNQDSLSNGFLMRNTPLAVWIYFNFKDALEFEFSIGRFTIFEQVFPYILEETCHTHSNGEATMANFIHCFIIFSILREHNKSENLSITACFEKVWENLATFLDHLEMRDFMKFGKYPFKALLKEIKDKKIQSKSDAVNYLRSKRIGIDNQGYYLHALLLCFFYVKNIGIYANEQNPFDEIILTVCDLGGDTDTNAAILGGVLGAGFGYKNFSSKVNDMLNCVIINAPGRSDGKRALYSPGLILFVINEIYRMSKQRLTTFETQIKDFDEYRVKYAEKDYDNITDEEYEENKKKTNEFNNLVFKSASSDFNSFDVNLVKLMFDTLLN